MTPRIITLTAIILTITAGLLVPGCQTAKSGGSPTIQAGQDAYDRGDFATSIRLLSDYLEQGDHSDDAEAAMYLRGLSAAKSGKRQMAYADLRRCVESAKSGDVRWRAGLLLGVMYFEDNQWNDASRTFNIANSNMPERSPMDFVLWRLGQCYERTGRWSLATTQFEKLVQKFPSSEFAANARRRAETRPTYFAVRCGAFGNVQNAQRMATDLRQQGFSASVRLDSPTGKPLHIVLVGTFPTYEAALQQVAALRSVVPDATIWP